MRTTPAAQSAWRTPRASSTAPSVSECRHTDRAATVMVVPSIGLHGSVGLEPQHARDHGVGIGDDRAVVRARHEPARAGVGAVGERLADDLDPRRAGAQGEGAAGQGEHRQLPVVVRRPRARWRRRCRRRPGRRRPCCRGRRAASGRRRDRPPRGRATAARRAARAAAPGAWLPRRRAACVRSPRDRRTRPGRRSRRRARPRSRTPGPSRRRRRRGRRTRRWRS